MCPCSNQADVLPLRLLKLKLRTEGVDKVKQKAGTRTQATKPACSYRQMWSHFGTEQKTSEFKQQQSTDGIRTSTATSQAVAKHASTTLVELLSVDQELCQFAHILVQSACGGEEEEEEKKKKENEEKEKEKKEKEKKEKEEKEKKRRKRRRRRRGRGSRR